MPAVVAEGAEIGLVDSAADEMGRQVIVIEHVGERVRLALEPERGGLVDVGAAAQEDGAGFAGIVDEGGIWGNGGGRFVGRAGAVC